MSSRGNKYTNAWDRGKPKLKDKKNTASAESWGISYGDAAVYGLGLAASAALGLYVASVKKSYATATAPAPALEDVNMAAAIDSAAEKKMWQEDWDDEEVDEDFAKQLRAQIRK